MAYYMIVDTETTDKYARKTSQPEPENSLVYDYGFVVVDSKTFEVVDSASFVISETFNNSKLINSAYYAAKLPQYYNGTKLDKSGEWQMVDCLTAYTVTRDIVKKYGIRKVWAYNCKFDLAALNSTVRTYSNGFAAFWFPYGVKVCDIWDYAANLTSSKSYLRYVAAHNMFTANGNPKTNAETVYAYLTRNADYTERHTALEDCKIETAILAAARKRHSGKHRATRGQGWRDAANVWHEMNV